MGNKQSAPAEAQPRLFSQGPIRAEAYNERQDEPEDPEEQVFFNRMTATELFKRLAKKDPELKMISGPNVWLIMEQARAWTKYTMNSTRKLLMIFCRPDDQYPRGRISWGHDRMYPDGTFDLKELSTIWIGKRRGPFLTPIAQHADEDRCATFVGSNGFTMHVEAPTRGLLTLWLFGINFALSSSGHDAFIGLNTDGLQLSFAQGEKLMSMKAGLAVNPLTMKSRRRPSIDATSAAPPTPNFGATNIDVDIPETTVRRRRSSVDGSMAAGLASPGLGSLMGPGVGAGGLSSLSLGSTQSPQDTISEEEALAMIKANAPEVPPPQLGFLVSEEVLFAARDPQILLRTLEAGFLLSSWSLADPIPPEVYRRKAVECARSEDPFGGITLEQVSQEPQPRRSSLKGARRASLLNASGSSQGGSAIGQHSHGGNAVADRNAPLLHTIIPSEYGDFARIGRPGQLAFPVPAALSYNPKTDTLHLRSQLSDQPSVQRLRHQHFQLYHSQHHQHQLMQLQHQQWEETIHLSEIDQIVLGKGTAELLSTHCSGMPRTVCVTIIAGDRIWNLTADTPGLMNNMLCALNLLFTEHNPKLLIYDDPNLPEGDVEKSFWIVSERMHAVAREKDKIPRFVDYALHAPQVSAQVLLNALKQGFAALRPTKPQRSREAQEYGHDSDVIVKNKIILWSTVDARRAKAVSCSLHFAIYPGSNRKPEKSVSLMDIRSVACGKTHGLLTHPQCRNLPDARCLSLLDESGASLLDLCFEASVGDNSRAAFLAALDVMLRESMAQTMLAPLPPALQTPKPDQSLYGEDGLPKAFVCNIMSIEAANKATEAE